LRHCQQCQTPLLGAPGTLVLGRYRLEELLSTADGVAVYRATDVQEGNRPVLLEDLLEIRPLNFLQKQQLFRHTVEKMRRLEPLPAIPRLYDFIEEGQTALVVREDVQGRPLDEVLKHDGPLGVTRVWAWATQLCDVLGFMHAQSPPYLWMVLTPRDLVVQDDGRTLRVWPRSRSMMPWREPAAARYVAPEVLAGKAEPRSDLFTLAATLYHLATGKAPEGAETGRELRQKVEREGPTLGEEAVFWAALGRNLSESVGERHASAPAFRAALVGGG
jgi:serine/threonine-protein kinase